MKTNAVYSVGTLDLQSLKAQANALKKREGMAHSFALEKAAREIGLPSWRIAAEMLRLPFSTNEFHRIYVGELILVLWWSACDFVPERAGLYIDGYKLPKKTISENRMEDYWIRQVVWGDVTKLLFYPEDDAWWFCKYGYVERLLLAPDINADQAKRVGELLGVVCFAPGQEAWHPMELENAITRPYPDCFNALIDSDAFRSLRAWSSKHPQLVEGLTSDYFPQWGKIALHGGRFQISRRP